MAELLGCRAPWYYGYMTQPLSAARRELIGGHWPEILKAIAAGARVDKTCEAHGLSRIDVWQYRNGNPELTAQWYDAMKDSADAFLDRMLEEIDGAGKDAKAARVRLTALQWIAEKRDPDRYGQRIRSDVNVKTVDLTAIIKDANARLIAAQQGRVIEHTDNNCEASNLRAHAHPALPLALSALL